MFTNYPLWMQIITWGIFMGLNGCVGGTIPFANLAVLGFTGALGFKHGGWFTTLASVAFVAEFICFLGQAFASIGPGKDCFFIQTGMGMINFVLGIIVFFILLNRAKIVLPGPIWITVSLATVCYLAGLSVSMLFWNPIFAALAIVPLAFICIPSMVTAGVVLAGVLSSGYIMFLGPILYHEHIKLIMK